MKNKYYRNIVDTYKNRKAMPKQKLYALIAYTWGGMIVSMIATYCFTREIIFVLIIFIVAIIVNIYLLYTSR